MVTNLSDFNDVDEWYCSGCGIRLGGWSKLLPSRDDEWGTLDEYEYAFKFCPECGEQIGEDKD